MTNVTASPQSAAVTIAEYLFAESLSDQSQILKKNGDYPKQTQDLSALSLHFEPQLSESSMIENVEILFSGFDYAVSAPIVDVVASDDRQRIAITLQPDKNVSLFCGLAGTNTSSSGNLRIQEVTFQIKVSVNTPRANFVAATLQALLWLSSPVHLRIPELHFDTELSFTVPLRQISHFLHHRQVSYQMMVIERSFDKTFLLPELSAEDEEKIGFAFRAIMDRSVTLPFHQHSFPIQADEKTRASVEAGNPFPYRLIVKQFDIELLGENLPLGEVALTIENAKVIDPAEARREVESLDNHQFMIGLRSLDGAIRYDFADPPRLPDRAWDEQLERLISLGRLLDRKLMDSYHNLAGATLANLTPEEQDEITTRPELDESAFEFDEDENEKAIQR